MLALKLLLRTGFEYVEDCFDIIFGAKWNPFYQLGALGWFYYWIVVVSGLYLYIFFDTGVTQAYESLEYLTHEQWYAGGIMRSLHRYASDALVVMIVVHLLREFAMDRFRSARWFAWITGVPMLWLVFAAGISGYWMVWDQLAQYIAITTAELFDSLPFFGESIARNFLMDSKLSGRFFTLMVFIHIAVPLFMLFMMWIHILRHASPKVNPPKELAIGTFSMLLILSFVKPALSQAPADLKIIPATVNLDWFYLPVYPILNDVSGITVWITLILATIFLMFIPWMPPGKKTPVAEVHLDNCNGCSRCAADCPFSAISMEPRTDGSNYKLEAVVDADHCVSCGICVGACPTATPFRTKSNLSPGIELPEDKIAELREKTIAASEKLTGDDRVLVYGCGKSLNPAEITNEEVGVVTMPCIGMLPPSFIDFVLSKKLADGVFLTGCRDGDCSYRLGIKWTDARLASERDPHIRKRVNQDRIGKYWAGLTRSKQFFNELTAFRQRLKKLSLLETETAAESKQSSEKVDV
ncbi:MAG: hydrogenase iron-sulfur subunit [Proteobacteria bacterium]|nr:hydrogenase iron-sulfur subunit [Pseudomonadota bacterium]NOG61563.1 hydrogenase iron-sulfur subunit [Pseudomonadota bacterium]